LKSPDKLGETLTVNEDSKKDFYIKGVVEESVSSINEILDKLRKGESNRHYARTAMNHASSRSHTIFRLHVQTVTNNFIREYRRQKRGDTSNINNTELVIQAEESFLGGTGRTEGTMVTESLLNFVDLAGSEKVSNHHMLLDDPNILNTSDYINSKEGIMAVNKVKERVKEGQHINKSLFFLTQVISLKSEGKSAQHIPYRNSPLTKILRSSLGGNSRTLIILCITPVASQFEQTMSTLRFGMNAKKIENQVQANIITNNDDEALKILISDYEKKLKDLENARHEDYIKNAQLHRQIEELQMQKAKLIEKVENLSKFQIMKMSQSIPNDEISEFFKQAKERLIYFDKVGVIFNSKKLKKYDIVKTESTASLAAKVRNFEKRRSTELSSRRLSELPTAEVDPELIEDLPVNPRIITESVNKFSLAALKSSKHQVSVLQKMIEKLYANLEQASRRNLNNYDNFLIYFAKAELRKKQLKDLANDFNDQLEEKKKLKAKLDLYKDLKRIEDLNDAELNDLEAHFWKKLDEIKMEKCRRLYARQLQELKSYTGKSPSPLRRRAHADIDPIEPVNFTFDSDFEEFGDSRFEIELILNDDNIRAEKLQAEENAFFRVAYEGIKELDAELAESKRIANETEAFFKEKNEEKLRLERRQRNKSEKKGSPFLDSKRSSTATLIDRSASIDRFSRKGSRNPSIPKLQETKLDFVQAVMNVHIEPVLPKLNKASAEKKKESEKKITKPIESTTTVEIKDNKETKEPEEEFIEQVRPEVKPFQPESTAPLHIEDEQAPQALPHSPKKEEEEEEEGRSSVESPRKLYNSPRKLEASPLEHFKSLNFEHSPLRRTSRTTDSPDHSIMQEFIKTERSVTPTPSQKDLKPKQNKKETQSKSPILKKSATKTTVKNGSKSPITRDKENNTQERRKSTSKSPIGRKDSGKNNYSFAYLASNPPPNKKDITDKYTPKKVSPLKKSATFSKTPITAISETLDANSKSFTGILLNTLERQMTIPSPGRFIAENLLTERTPSPIRAERETMKENFDLTARQSMRNSMSLLNDKEINPEKFPLNVTNIEKDETMFSNSIFSTKNGEKLANESIDYDYLKERENEILRNLENSPIKSENFNEHDNLGDSTLNESKKRRTRADRKKRTALATTNE